MAPALSPAVAAAMVPPAAPVADDEEAGFYVFYPGLGSVPTACSSTRAALRLGVAKLGNWGSALPRQHRADRGSAPGEARADERRQAALAASAWDPLDGPGWRGIYTDLRSREGRRAAAEDVVECDSLSPRPSRCGVGSTRRRRFEQERRRAEGRGHGAELRRRGDNDGPPRLGVAAGIHAHAPLTAARGGDAGPSETFAEGSYGRRAGGGITCCEDSVGLGLLGATIVERDGIFTGVAIFAARGCPTRPRTSSATSEPKARWAATLDGVRVAFEVGRSAYSRNSSGARPVARGAKRMRRALQIAHCGSSRTPGAAAEREQRAQGRVVREYGWLPSRSGGHGQADQRPVPLPPVQHRGPGTPLSASRAASRRFCFRARVVAVARVAQARHESIERRLQPRARHVAGRCRRPRRQPAGATVPVRISALYQILR